MRARSFNSVIIDCFIESFERKVDSQRECILFNFLPDPRVVLNVFQDFKIQRRSFLSRTILGSITDFSLFLWVLDVLLSCTRAGLVVESLLLLELECLFASELLLAPDCLLLDHLSVRLLLVHLGEQDLLQIELETPLELLSVELLVECLLCVKLDEVF